MTTVATTVIRYAERVVGIIAEIGSDACLFRCEFCNRTIGGPDMRTVKRAFTNHAYLQHRKALAKLEEDAPAAFWNSGRQLWRWAA